MLLSTGEIKMKRFVLLSVFLFTAGVACSGEPMGQEIFQSLVIDPIISAYLDQGYHIKPTIALEDGKPGISGGFQVLNREGKIVVEGTFSHGRFEGDLKVYSEGQIVFLERHKNGKSTGDSIEWDKSGRLIRITRYDNNGQKTGTEVGYNDGVVIFEMDWAQGKPLETRRFESGKIVERVSGTELLDLMRARALMRARDLKESQAQPEEPSK